MIGADLDVWGRARPVPKVRSNHTPGIPVAFIGVAEGFLGRLASFGPHKLRDADHPPQTDLGHAGQRFKMRHVDREWCGTGHPDPCKPIDSRSPGFWNRTGSSKGCRPTRKSPGGTKRKGAGQEACPLFLSRPETGGTTRLSGPPWGQPWRPARPGGGSPPGPRRTEPPWPPGEPWGLPG